MIVNFEKAMAEAFQCINDIGCGRHNRHDGRGTTELSVKVLLPLAEILANFVWSDGESYRETKIRLAALFERENAVLSSYPNLMAFALDKEVIIHG